MKPPQTDNNAIEIHPQHHDSVVVAQPHQRVDSASLARTNDSTSHKLLIDSNVASTNQSTQKNDSVALKKKPLQKRNAVLAVHRRDSLQQVKLDSLANLFYKGYEHKIQFYSLSDSVIVPFKKYTTQNIVNQRDITFKGTQRKPLFPQWMVLVLLVTILLTGIVKYLRNDKLTLLFKSFFNIRLINQFSKDSSKTFTLSDIFLWVNYIISFAIIIYVLIYKIIPHNIIPLSPFLVLLSVALGILAYHCLKFLAIHFLGIIFNKEELTNIYILNASFLHQTIGIIIIPANLLFFFFNYGNYNFIWFNVILLIISYLWMLAEGVILSRKKMIQYIYIFLYLCTLEILPLIILFKSFVVNK